MKTFNRLRIVICAIALLFVFHSKSFCQQTSSGNVTTKASISLPDSIESYVKGVYQKIEEKNRYVSALSSEELGTLPLAQVREINGKVYAIAIDSARLTPDKGAFFSAYFRFTFPGTNEELIFRGRDIAFNPGGIGLSSSSKLILLNDKTVHISEHVDLTFSGDGSNYIEWDCNGFKAANLHGVFEFDPGMIKPEDATQAKVRASFKVNVHDLNNILAAIDIPAFKISGLEDFSFMIRNAVVDMSDIANPDGLIVTSDMLSIPGNPQAWRGFYLGELEVGLPAQLSTEKGRPKIAVRNFYIDEQGVSGVISAENLIQLGDASAGGWPLSVDKIALSFSRNKLNGGELGGLMQIGFLGDDPLRYNAMVSMRNNDTYYNFSLATTQDSKPYKFFAGEIVLGANSRIQVAKTERDFIPTAILNGKLNINKSVLSINQVTFQDLTLSTQKPYVHSGTFNFSNSEGKSKAANFPIGFDDLSLGIYEGKVAVGGTIRLNFMNSEDKGFGGSTSFLVTASQREDIKTVMVKDVAVQKTTTRWGLDKVMLNNIVLDVKVSAFTLHGELAIFDEHPVYGNGFRGSLSFTIPGPIPSASATAYFGSKDDYRYWHVDAYIGTNLPIPPAINITGMMGGMSYHMERPADFDPYAARNAVDADSGRMKSMNEIFQYVPNKDAGLGFMGGVSLSLVQQMVVNVNVALEVQFGSDGGFRYAQFDGAGYVLHAPKKAVTQQDAEADESAPIWCRFYMRYDNVNHTFDASAKTYINILGVLKGVNERGLVGEAALHVGPNDWWFYIGRPSQMFGLNILGLAEVKSYFMMGTKVEDMPPLPAEVNEVFENVNTNFMAMENSMSTGSGFGFGAHFMVGFKFDFGVYGEFAIGAGTDILLRNYGEARCKGSNSPLGFNGWYASGQAYAFLKGDVGIRVKVFGKKRGFSIAKLSAAVLLQAKLPNPSWFRGMVGVKYSVLGGLIKGKANIKVELGTQCEIVGQKEIDIQVISDIKPEDKTSDVSVFARPQVAFNMPVEKPFDMLNEYDEVASYRIKLQKFTLTDDKKKEINGVVETDEEGMSASLMIRDVLPSTTKLTAFASIIVERKDGNNWSALKNGSSSEYENKSAIFTTGEAPDYIPWENVAYAYPVKRQHNFLPQEYPEGYIKLKQGQPYLFATTDEKGKKWKVSASYDPAIGDAVSTALNYNAEQMQVSFNVPQNLNKETIYSFHIRRTSLDGESGSKNVTSSEQTHVEDGDTTTIRQTTLKGTAASGIEKEIITLDFRTSMYRTFKEKMDAATAPTDVWDIANNYTMVIGQQFTMSENFDKFELGGDNSFATKPLIALKAGKENGWLKDKIMPLLYNDYPASFSLTFDNTHQQFRDGAAPLYAVSLYNSDNAFYQLEESAIREGQSSSKPGRSRFMYYVGFVANDDYHDLLNKATRYYINGGSKIPTVNRLLTTTFPDLVPNLYYPVELQYRLPGINKVTSTVERKIFLK